MAWIESHQELARHPKAKRLAREIGERVQTAVGLLHFLWWWSMDYAPDGDLTKFAPADIADGLMWDGDPDVLIQALINSGFVDESEDGEITIHDWDEYAGRLIEKREQNAKRMQETRAKKKTERATHVQRTHSERAEHEPDTNKTRAGLPTYLPTNITIPNIPNIVDAGARARDDDAAANDDDDVDTQPVSGAALQDPSTNPAINPYAEIEGLMQEKMVKPRYAIMGKDYDIAKELLSRVPLEFILDGIRTAFDEYKPRYAADSIQSFAYCSAVIERLWAEKMTRDEAAATVYNPPASRASPGKNLSNERFSAFFQPPSDS